MKKFILIVSILCPIYLIGFSMWVTNDLRSWKEGPHTQSIRTDGVFKPGGVLRLFFEPGIKAIENLYFATGALVPGLTKDQLDKGIVWPTTSISRKAEWSKKIKASRGYHNYSVRIGLFMPIPSNDSLIGEKVQLKLRCSIRYPEEVSPNRFENHQKEFMEDLFVSIMGPDKLSFGEKVSIWIKCTKVGQFLLTPILIAGLIAFIGSIGCFADLTKRLRKKKGV